MYVYCESPTSSCHKCTAVGKARSTQTSCNQKHAATSRRLAGRCGPLHRPRAPRPVLVLEPVAQVSLTVAVGGPVSPEVLTHSSEASTAINSLLHTCDRLPAVTPAISLVGVILLGATASRHRQRAYDKNVREAFISLVAALPLRVCSLKVLVSHSVDRGQLTSNISRSSNFEQTLFRVELSGVFTEHW